MKGHIACAGRTDVGRVRNHNEDAFFIAENCGVCAVADGMGGHERGEVASALVVETFAHRFGTETPLFADLETASRGLKEAVEEANRTIYEQSSATGRIGAMGTTVVAAAMVEGRAVVAHVGDSRAYVLRGTELVQITRDHSFVWELYEKGVISRDEMRSHPRRNVITRALGTHGEVQVDIEEADCGEGDVVLLCSDGLSGMLGDREIASLVGNHRDDLASAADALVNVANRGGGDDNITVVLMRVV